MTAQLGAGGRVSGRRLAELLGAWRANGVRHASTDLAAAIRKLVLDGLLPVGTRLPAERELASALDASRTMVGAALDRLRADGVVASRRGAGSWITLPGPGRPLAEPESPDLIDLAQAAPEALPGFVQAVDRARLRLPAHLGGHGYPQRGLGELRQRIARRYTARGLPTGPDEIVVTSGAHNGFSLLLRMLGGPGDRVLVDQPTYPNALDAMRSAHTIPVGVPLREDGWDLAEIEATLRQAAPRLAYLIVDFQNPTGLRLGAEGRERLAGALRRTRTPTVIDETLVDVDLDGDPLDGPPPMALFGEDLVFTIGSASKSHWGGLRLGWIRAPRDVISRIVVNRPAVDLGAALFEQLVLVELLDGPESAASAWRAELARRRDTVLDALGTHCPQWSFRRPEGGLSVWCQLDRPISSRLAVAAESVGIRLAPGSRFGVNGGLERRIRIPYSLPVPELVDAVSRIGRVAAALPGAEDELPVQVS
jgi:DNA-binding transcriptional MocR family regulator